MLVIQKLWHIKRLLEDKIWYLKINSFINSAKISVNIWPISDERRGLLTFVPPACQSSLILLFTEICHHSHNSTTAALYFTWLAGNGECGLSFKFASFWFQWCDSVVLLTLNIQKYSDFTNVKTSLFVKLMVSWKWSWFQFYFGTLFLFQFNVMCIVYWWYTGGILHAGDRDCLFWWILHHFSVCSACSGFVQCEISHQNKHLLSLVVSKSKTINYIFGLNNFEFEFIYSWFEF